MTNENGLLSLDQDLSSLVGKNVETLLCGTDSSHGGELDENEGSLISSDDVMSFVELNNDAMMEHEIELRRKYFSDPKNQAKILLDDYVKNQTILVNHNQRRRIYAEFLRNAKKGKYKKIFSDYINGISKEESQKNFSKLNG